jgi:hypothetical protein
MSEFGDWRWLFQTADKSQQIRERFIDLLFGQIIGCRKN